MSTVGTVALYVVFALAVYATGAAVLAGRRRDRRLMRSASNALVAAFVAVLVAVVALEYAIVTHDFSIAVVADHTSRALPFPYLVTSLWASQPGSLLLWLTVLLGSAALVMYQNRHRNRELMPWVAAVMGGTAIFFSAMAAFVSPPFQKLPAAQIPADKGYLKI